LVLVFCSVTLRAQGDIVGTWLTADGKTKVEIQYVDENTLEGKVVWLKQPTNDKGEPLKDARNPKRSLRDRTIMGLALMQDVRADGQVFEGELYSPKRGKTFDVRLTLLDADRLQLMVSYRGFTREQIWTRSELIE